MAVTTLSVLTGTTDSINNQARALEFAMPYLAYPMFGTMDSVAERKGLTIKWYRHAAVTEVTATLAESPTWAPTSHSVDTVTTQMAFYGGGREITELLDRQSVFDLRPDLLVWAGEEAGRSINAVTRAALLAGTTNIRYANQKTSATFTSTDTPDLDDFVDMAKLLKDQDAPTFVIGGQQCYVAIISPNVEAYLMKTQAFRDAVTRTESMAQRYFGGYLATIFGICFVRTSTTVTTSVTGQTVDQTIICGRDAFGVPALPLLGGTGTVPKFTGFAPDEDTMVAQGAKLNEMFSVLVTEPGDGSGGGAHGDEWATRFKVAWKAYWKCQVLNTNWIINFRSVQ